jgi:hypothetical protein
MSEWMTIQVKWFRVRNKNTGKEYEYNNFEEADRGLNDMRESHEGSECEMIAVVDV